MVVCADGVITHLGLLAEGVRCVRNRSAGWRGEAALIAEAVIAIGERKRVVVQR